VLGYVATMPVELFSETNNDSVAILLTYGTARVLLAGDTEVGRRHTWRTSPTRGLKRSSTFRNYTHSELRFRTLLTEDGPQQIDLERA
jgi:hypothetical protein